jgi:hypothetical protein
MAGNSLIDDFPSCQAPFGSGIFQPATFEKRIATVLTEIRDEHRKKIGLNGTKFLASSLDISKSRWILKMPSPLYGPNGMWKFPTSKVVFKGLILGGRDYYYGLDFFMISRYQHFRKPQHGQDQEIRTTDTTF